MPSSRDNHCLKGSKRTTTLYLPGRGSLAAGLLVGARGSDMGLRRSEQLLSTNLGLLTAKATGQT